MTKVHNSLSVARISNRCTVLGPGVRAVVWVQGCPLRCRGCVASETLPFAGGTVLEARALGRQLSDLDISGITFSGGEPTSQASALVSLIDEAVAYRPDLTFMSYSGFTIEYLLKQRDPDQLAFLRRLDLLVDGPYVESLHTNLRWRGSSNQRIIFMSNRLSSLTEEFLNDRGTWIEFESNIDSVQWMGIPPLGFRERFERGMESIGVTLGHKQE